jgi:basic membrane protein A and related proteins
VDPSGNLDTKFACKGDAKTLLPHYISLAFKEDQAGYLAGIVAASVTKKGAIGAIGGTTLCAPCVRYIQGYELGAKSVKADIAFKAAYVTRDFSNAAFYDQPGGKTFANNFLTTSPNTDVLFQVAGLTGNGVLDAACAANIYGIGVDVDAFLSYPAAGKCLVTSAEKHLELATSSVIAAIAAGSATPGDNSFSATNNGIGVSLGHDLASAWPADLQGKLDAALAAMKAGSLVTCPATGCGVGPK